VSVGTVVYDSGRWVIKDIQNHAIARLKALFPRIPKTQAPPYVLPDTLQTAEDLLWFESRYRLDMDPMHRMTLEAMRQRAHRKAEKLALVASGDYLPPAHAGIRPFSLISGEPNVLRAYQKLAVDVLEGSNGLLLVDDVGLGKSYVGAAACLIPGALPAAIVCDVHLRRQWVEVIRDFTELTVVEIKTTQPARLKKLPEADVYVFSYSQLAGWSDHFDILGINLAVFDECQALRTGVESQKGQGAARLSMSATWRMGLSATPIYNYGIEIHNIMMFIKPDLLGSYEEFSTEWAPTGTIKDPGALASYLKAEHVFLRRTKKDVGKEMPQVNTIIQDIEFEGDTIKEATEFAKALAVKATTGTFMERGQAARDLDMKLRQYTGMAKARQIAAFVRMVVESGQPVIVGLWHREVYAILMKNLEDLKPAMYTGSESGGQKDKEAKRFMNGETDVLLMSLRSGAGLNGLQFRCSTCIIGELDWSPGVHHQLIGRLNREGQTEPVTAFYLTIEEGSDPPMMDMLGLKASQAAAIIDNGLGVQHVESDVSRLQVLVQRYLDKKAA
jgi:SNF2 family DNA or RNA helicase